MTLIPTATVHCQQQITALAQSKCHASRNLKVTMKILALASSLKYSHHAKIWLIGKCNTLAWHPPTLRGCNRRFSHPIIIGFSHQPQSDWINPHTTIFDHHRSTGDPQSSVINPVISFLELTV